MHACNMLGHPQHPLGDATALRTANATQRRLGRLFQWSLATMEKNTCSNRFSPSNTPPLCGVTLHFLHNRVYGINVEVYNRSDYVEVSSYC